ncbi:MAG: hypothetical protein K0Q90_1425 [Paenibacillaceae bacterium]|jgi:AraC-like DNA-binding protein|nr:hypothetical protein [Paenibacillaceae bacterium]
MQKKWLYRLILSYLPILLAVVFCLILVFFLTLNETTKRQTIQANRVFGGQVMQIVDATLQNIETMASKGLLLNEQVIHYFDEAELRGTYDYYLTTNALLDYMAPLPIIDSVYLYRESDGKVLMQSFSSQIDEFGDTSFIRQAMGMKKPYMWSGIRNLRVFAGDEQNRPVVTLGKRIPYYSGEQGLIVINIRSSSLQALVRDMQIDGGARVCLADESGNSFANPGISCTAEQKLDDVYVRSAYSGFQLRMGLQKGNWIPLLSSFTYVWFVFGFIVVVGGIVAMTYISHRHYRPLEQLLNRVQAFGQRKNSLLKRTEEDDDFAFIDHALESLIEGTNNFEQQEAEGLLYRRIYFFKELLEGVQVLPRGKLNEEAQKLGIAFSFEQAIVGIVEMDYYEAFVAEYNARDQSLFKFTVRSAIQEITAESEVKLWAEWISPNRLGLLYWRGQAELEDGSDSGQTFHEIIASMSERARLWVEQYLKFTVTFGFGGQIGDVLMLSSSYEQAVTAVDRKISSGPNHVYHYMEQSGYDEGMKMDALLQELKEAAQLFRLGNPDWEERFNRSFTSMASGDYGKDDIARIVRVFKAQIAREMQEAPVELQDAWKQEGLEKLQAVHEQYEWVEEAKQALLKPLLAAGQLLQALRSNREQYSQAASVRQFIVENFTDPNLSLAQISEAFDINLKTLSRIFKEEFGEKFVDYLTRLRIERAKELLEHSQESVQSISENVGYLYTMSFIRVFKKSVGTTPGDYRKERETRTRGGQG